MPVVRAGIAKAQPYITSWSGDWKCSCGAANKLWDNCVCGTASPCREYVRGNCLLPKCRFPHPAFKIPEHLPKPADPIANPPAAAAKQKAAAQAAAAALAAEASGPKEMAIVTWLGHWQCDCGKVHKLWDSCKCGQAPPCREWVRGQCNISKCRFPHPPFAIPSNLPKPDDPIANPTLEQLQWSKEHLAAGGGSSSAKPPAAANGKAGGAGSSGDSTPVAGLSSSASVGSEAGGGANGAADRAVPPPPPPPPSAIMQPGVSFRQALLKSQQAAAEAAAAAAGASAAAHELESAFRPAAAVVAPPPPPPPPVEQPPPPPPPPVLSPRAGSMSAAEQQAVLSPRSLPHVNIAPMHHQQQQNGLSASDPVTAAPLSARGDPQVVAALGGGWNPLGGQGGGGSLLSVASQGNAAPMGQHPAAATAPPPQPPTPSAPPMSGPPPAAGPPQPTAAQQQAALAAQLGAPGSNPAAGGAGQHMMGSLTSPTAAAAAAAVAQQQMQAGGGASSPAAAQYTLQQALQQMALQQQAAAQAQAKAQQQAAAQQQQAAAAAQQKPLRAIAHTLLEGGLMDPAFYHALGQVDFLPDGHYQQDSITLEDQQRRMELFNNAVDSYIAAGVDRRSMLEIECAAKIGLSGGPLYYRCATCGNPMSERMRPSWCPGCKATPFCSQECHRVLYAQHRAVCSSMLTKPLLPSQIALRMAVEVHTVHGAAGAALQQAVLRQMGAVQRSYQAAAAAAAAAGVVDE